MTFEHSSQKSLSDRLDEYFTADSDLALGATCEQVEVFLLQESTRIILSIFESFAEKQREHFSAIQLDGFVLGRDSYVVTSDSHGTRLSIEVKLIEKAASQLAEKGEFARLSSNGRMTEVAVRTDPKFESLQAEICGALVANLELGYRWLEAHVLSLLESLRHSAAEELYLRLRKRLTAEVVSYVWLYVVAEGKGFYVPDRTAQSIALNRTATRNILATSSPLELLVEFATLPLSFESTHSKDAVASRALLPQAFPLAKYAGTGFQIAEQAVYDCRDYLIHPLVVEGSLLLTAGYPENVRSEVFEVLEQEKAHFKEILEGNASRFRRFLHDLKNQHALPRFIDAGAGPMGKLLRGFIDGPP